MPRPQRLRVAPFLALLLALLTANWASAGQRPMSASEFEDYTEGKTLYFYSGGEAYGVEEYHPDRRVTWSFLDGQCKEGVWYPQGDEICFIYEDNPTPQCWTFYEEAGRLRAQFEGRDGGTVLYEAGEADEAMMCLGPDVGV
ncbi:MAG: hypothetical protein AAGG09_19550 [Pseudomonadota bacterium]